ncbi:hypothetical protein I4U23_005273 [Adineta vaga]|nr:hypothetical protein I4U23_005273 [Adineta vaga]
MADQTANEKMEMEMEKEVRPFFSIATTFEEIDLGHNVSTNSTIPHFLPDRYDKADDDEESWDSDGLDVSGWSDLPDPYESLNLLLMIMESAEDNQTDKKAQKRNHRGTRRQQRYRAKAKLLQLCELASAQAPELMAIH